MAVSSGTAPVPQPGDRWCDRYLVLEVIGQGGMGRVVSARNEATGKRVALKHLLEPSPEAAARFDREARAAGRIHHPNVVDVYDVLHHEGTMCLVMELLRGEPLSSILAREQRLSVEETVSIGLQIARGVEAAHREGVIHRDLKPANVFVCEREPELLVKILDFGISKLIEPEASGGATGRDVVLGTPHYLSPEQVRGGRVDPRVDVYAMGALLYTMLTGRPPHDHPHLPALLVEIATAAPTPVQQLRPEVVPALCDLVHRALAKEPDARFPTAASLAEALRGVATALSHSHPSGADVAHLESPTLPVARVASSIPRPEPAVAPAPARAATVGSRSAPRRAWVLMPAAGAVVLGVLAVASARTTPTSEAPPASASTERSHSEPTRAGDDEPAPVPPPAASTERPTPLALEASEATPPPIAPAGSGPPPRRTPAPRNEPSARADGPATDSTADAPAAAHPPTTARHRAGRLGLDDF